MENTVKKRIPALDNIKGILIILVVFAHCLYDFQASPLINYLTDIIYVFHMPAFIFFTGYLSKSAHSRGKDALVRLLGAYLFFNTIMMVYQFSVNSMPISLLTPYNSYWYILAVIVWRGVAERFSKVRGALVYSVLFAVAVGFLPEFTNYLSLARIVAFLPFFLAGYMLPSEKYEAMLEKRKASGSIKGILLIAVSCFAAYILVRQYNVADSALTMFAYQSAAEAVVRIFVFAISAMVIAGLLLCVPNREIPMLTGMGRNSLSIFLLHRIPTLLIPMLLADRSDAMVLFVAVAATILLTAGLGCEAVVKQLDRLLDFIRDILLGCSKSKHAPITKVCVTAAAVMIIGVQPLATVLRTMQMSDNAAANGSAASTDRIYPQMSAEEIAGFEDDATLLFTGDLLLLEDQVKRGFKDGVYDFSDLFEYTKRYISEADLAIGVFEGPMAGEAAGYSTSNYDDGKTLALNYPDEFGKAVKDAGFDLVTTANNHLLDKNTAGAMRTLDVLDEIGLDHVGSYRNEDEKSRIKIVSCDGVKIAVLAYTYGSNGYSESDFIDGRLSYVTSLTADPSGEYFEAAKAAVSEDFKRAKELSPDMIVVLSHMGEQFLNAPDFYQQTWNEFFISCGADAVLNDHTHSVQPVQMFNREGKTKVIVNCPGNYVNIFREYNGDASAMVEVYIDKNDKSITGASVIPMWIEAPMSGNYRPLPIYDILNDEALQSSISTDDLIRIEEVQRHVTRVMLGTELATDVSSERYYLTESGYAAVPCKPLIATDSEKQSALYKKLTEAECVCFAGDSITEGTRNGGYGWYRPLESICKKTYQCAKGGGTTKSILPQVGGDASLYVVALGTNDVRYRDESVCAMTEEEYIAQLKAFTQRIRAVKPDAEFVFIAPWMALENDTVTVVSPPVRDGMLAAYSEALRTWCKEENHLYIDPNPAIKQTLTRYPESVYMVDFIHPNCGEGIAMYAHAVLAYEGE